MAGDFENAVVVAQDEDNQPVISNERDNHVDISRVSQALSFVPRGGV